MTFKETVLMKLMVQEELLRGIPAAHWAIELAIRIVEETEADSEDDLK